MRIVYFIILTMSSSSMTLAATFEDYRSVDINMMNAFQKFGTRVRRRSTNQEKRDLSLAYAATNINSKEGTQVKTITVIKNLGDDKSTAKLKIKPELHKSEDWAKAFKDNFDSYGIIPDVPDVDDLFEYVNKKHNNGKSKNENNEKGRKTTENEENKSTKNLKPKETDKPVFEMSSEETVELLDKKAVEKIEGDAELLPNFNVSRLKIRESLVNLNYSTPQHSVHQYFENYIQLSPNPDNGYDYQKPCVHKQPVSSVTVATPSGRTYNIPENNTNINVNPYLAPSITRRPQIQQQTSPPLPQGGAAVFPINSLLPPLQQSPGFPQTLQTNSIPTQQSIADIQQTVIPSVSQSTVQTPPRTTLPQQTQQPQLNSQTQTYFPSTSQRPYIAPNIRSGLSGVSRGPGSTPNIKGFQITQPGYRVNSYNTGFRRANVARSRGLKY